MFTICEHRFNGTSVPSSNIRARVDKNYTNENGWSASVTNGSLRRSATMPEVRSVTPEPGNTNWLNHKKQVLSGAIFNKSRTGAPFEIIRKGFKMGKTTWSSDAPPSSLSEVERIGRRRTGQGNYYIQRPGFMREPIQKRDPGKFSTLSLVGMSDAKNLVSLSKDTIGQLKSVNVYDPGDFEWLGEYNRRLQLGESEESISRNPPLGREQKVISQMRLPSLQSGESRQLATALTDDYKAGVGFIINAINTASATQTRDLADALAISSRDLETGVVTSIDALKDEVINALLDIGLTAADFPSGETQNEIVRLLDELVKGQTSVTIHTPGDVNTTSTHFDLSKEPTFPQLKEALKEGKVPDAWSINGVQYLSLDSNLRKLLTDAVLSRYLHESKQTDRSFTADQLNSMKFVIGKTNEPVTFKHLKNTLGVGRSSDLVRHSTLNGTAILNN